MGFDHGLFVLYRSRYSHQSNAIIRRVVNRQVHEVSTHFVWESVFVDMVIDDGDANS